MTDSAREAAWVRNPALLVSALAWIFLVAEPFDSAAHSHHHAMTAAAPASLATGWILMLVAMMLPVLVPPLIYIRRRSFTQRRVRSSALFIAGYTGVWMAAGCLLLAARLAAGVLAPNSFGPAACVLALATIWQCSPVKQVCLNRCHTHPELAAFGAAADFDAFRFGWSQGFWCAGSCWLWMLFPMTLPGGHVVAMAAVALLIFSERLEEPAAPGWRWRGGGRLIRMLAAQTRIRLHTAGLFFGYVLHQ